MYSLTLNQHHPRVPLDERGRKCLTTGCKRETTKPRSVGPVYDCRPLPTPQASDVTDDSLLLKSQSTQLLQKQAEKRLREETETRELRQAVSDGHKNSKAAMARLQEKKQGIGESFRSAPTQTSISPLLSSTPRRR